MKQSQNKIVLLNIFSTVLIQGINFLVSPVFARLLGTSNYGIVEIYNTWVSLFSTVLSLQAASTFAVARSSFPLDNQAGYQSSTISLSILVYTVLSSIVLFAAVFFLHYDNIVILVLCLFQGLAVYIINSINSKFTFEFKADMNFIMALSISALNIISSVCLIRVYPAETNYMGRILGQALTNICVAVFLYVYILKAGKVVYRKEYWLFSLPIAIPTIFHLLSNILLNQSDRLMLQSMINNSTVGIYSLAANLARVLVVLYGSLNNSWVPFYYEYMRTDDMNSIKEHSKNYIELFTVITCGFILLCPEVFHIYASRDFWEGTVLLPVFAVGNYFVFLYSFPVNYEFFHKKTQLIAVGTSLAAVFNIVLNYFLIKQFGIIGAVIATMIAHLCQFLFHYVIASYFIEGSFAYRFKQFIPGTIIVSIAAIASISSDCPSFIRWSIGITIGVFELFRIFLRKKIF